MADNNIIRIIYSELSDYVDTNDIKFYPSNELLKYVVNLKEYSIVILYYFADDFYRIEIEKIHNNQIQNVVFLTKAKIFHKDIKKILKENKLSGKSFENHMTGFVIFLNKILNNYGNLSYIEETYIPSLKFDGIFI